MDPCPGRETLGSSVQSLRLRAAPARSVGTPTDVRTETGTEVCFLLRRLLLNCSRALSGRRSQRDPLPVVLRLQRECIGYLQHRPVRQSPKIERGGSLLMLMPRGNRKLPSRSCSKVGPRDQ